MFTFLIVLIALIGVMITLVVLVQSGRGGGLAGIASGGATTQILGARQAPDVLEKATWTLATVFIVLCIMTNFTIGGEEVQDSVIQERAQQGQTSPTLPGQEQQIPGAEAPTQGQQQQLPEQQPIPGGGDAPAEGGEEGTP